MTAIDSTAFPSRRALLGAALGAMAATAATALGRPAAALAANGQPILQAAENVGTFTTTVRSNTPNVTPFQSVNDEPSGGAFGLKGRSSGDSGAGVLGQAFAPHGNTIGVWGAATSPEGAGVRGESPHLGVHGVAANTTGQNMGVFGENSSQAGAGVFGFGSHAAGVGVVGIGQGCGVVGSVTAAQATGVLGRATAGIGVQAEADATGIALNVEGKAVFRRSGRSTVAKGHSTVQVSGNPIETSTFVLATIQGVGEEGLAVRSVSASASKDQFTIRLTKPVAADTVVGWLILN